MKKVVRFLIFILAPIAVTIVYSTIQSFLADYTGIYYNIFLQIFSVLLGYILIGVTLFLICKTVLKRIDIVRIPYEFLIGILLALIPTIYYFLPVALPKLISVSFGIGMPISGLFMGVYICLFVILLHRRSKTLKARKIEQDNQASV